MGVDFRDQEGLERLSIVLRARIKVLTKYCRNKFIPFITIIPFESFTKPLTGRLDQYALNVQVY